MNSPGGAATQPTPEPSSTAVRSSSTPEAEEPYEVWTVADEQGAQTSAGRLLGGEDREAALVEAGRLYGRDHARARAALEDGTHPLRRLKRPEG
jgi:hypothetical protein